MDPALSRTPFGHATIPVTVRAGLHTSLAGYWVGLAASPCAPCNGPGLSDAGRNRFALVVQPTHCHRPDERRRGHSVPMGVLGDAREIVRVEGDRHDDARRVRPRQDFVVLVVPRRGVLQFLQVGVQMVPRVRCVPLPSEDSGSVSWPLASSNPVIQR